MNIWSDWYIMTRDVSIEYLVFDGYKIKMRTAHAIQVAYTSYLKKSMASSPSRDISIPALLLKLGNNWGNFTSISQTREDEFRSSFWISGGVVTIKKEQWRRTV